MQGICLKLWSGKPIHKELQRMVLVNACIHDAVFVEGLPPYREKVLQVELVRERSLDMQFPRIIMSMDNPHALVGDSDVCGDDQLFS